MIVRVLLLVLLALPQAALAEVRVALVIGNSAYERTGTLPNAVPDAEAIAALLKAESFAVTLVRDITRRALKDALDTFETAAASADVALIYYSGHGMQLDHENWIVPIDARLSRRSDVEDETISLLRLRQTVADARRLKVIILDACRDNPFLKTMAVGKRQSLPARGLSRVDAHAGEVIAFAAAEGATASDGSDGHSPYTRALLTRLKQPIDIRKLFGYVYEDVKKATTPPSGNEAEAQKPAVYIAALGGDDVFLGDRPAPPTPKPPAEDPRPLDARPGVQTDPCHNAGAHWQAISLRGERQLFEDHIRRFKGCGFDEIAALELRRLAEAEKKPNQPPRPPIAPPVAPPAVQQSQAEETECDRLAGHPRDKDRIQVVAGVDFARINAPLAVPACREAVARFPKSARLSFQLGRALEKDANHAEAVTAYRTAAELGHLLAMSNLASLLKNGQIPQTDAEAALQWYRKAADAGDTNAMVQIGYSYEMGTAVARDRDEALRWYRRAADAGSAFGMMQMGDAFHQGKGMPANDVEAAGWYRRAAALGNIYGHKQLGILYNDGRNGLARDVNEAATWFQSAADLGNAYSMTQLGIYHRDGIAVPQNLDEAQRWFRKAASLGDAPAAGALAALHAEGRLVRQDYAEAAKWLRLAVELGGRAQRDLLRDGAQALPLAYRRSLQQEFTAAGVYAGPATGVFDDATIAAVDALFARKN